MNARRDQERLVIHLNAFEARLLRRVLQVIAGNYRVGPAELDAQTAEVWYSDRGCQAAKMSADETRDWLAALHQVKRGHLGRLEEWVAALAVPNPSGHTLRLDLAAADIFLATINDYRLMVAARHHITEVEMDFRAESDVVDLPPARRAALMEIHLLAWLIEEMLSALGEPGTGAA